MKRKTLAAVAAGAGAVLALAACGSGGGSPTTGATSATGATSSAAPAPLSGELLIWDTGLLNNPPADEAATDKRGFLDRAVEMFNKDNPDVTVKVVQQGGDISANAAQFQAASIAKNGPDMRIQYAGGPTLSFAKFFTDLKGVLPESAFTDMTGWNTVRTDYSPEGEVVGMPYGSGLYFLVFANNKILREAGLDPAKTPQTWEEMLTNAQTIKDKTGTPGFWMANLEGYVGAWAVGALVGGELGEAATTDMYTGRVAVDDPGMLKAYQAWAALGASGLANPDAGQVSNGESTAGFIAGKGAYYLVGSWENPNMYNEFGDDVSWFYIPMLSGAKFPKAVAGGPSISISITNYAKNPDAAKAFLNFLSKPEVQTMYAEISQSEGSNNKLSNPDVIKNPLLRSQIAALPEYTPVVFPFDSVMPQPVIDLFYRLNASVFLGKTSPEDAVKQLNEANQAEISNR